MAHRYEGITAVLTTKHNKEKVLAPILAQLHIAISHHEFDTDQLGTFSGEIRRELNQRDTALKKARIGMAATGLRYGIASEGSVGPDPFIPFINSTVEAIAWIDEVNGIELVEFERGLEVKALKTEALSIDSLTEFLKDAEFPEHGLIVYAKSEKGEIYKGLQSWQELDEAIKRCAISGPAVVESDLRAHMSPSRRAVIRRCAEKLVMRLGQICPQCEVPGFGVVSTISGAPCESCGEMVARTNIGFVEGCAKCDFKVEKLNGKMFASAAECNGCNP